MPKSLSNGPLRRVLTAAVLLATLGGCAQWDNWLRGQQTDGIEENDAATGAPDTEAYIQELYRLVSVDPATQADIYADAAAAASLTPGPTTRLRLALILATPGHAESDPERAQGIFRDVLAQTELLTTSEISLATVHLLDVEQRLTLSRETARLREQSSRTADSEQLAVQQRLARAEAENRDLQKALAEAEQKLEAITTIERSIREQTENSSNQQ